MSKVLLRKRKNYYCCSGRDIWLPWKAGLPYMLTPHARLVHRVKHAQTMLRDGLYSHDIAAYWCGNSGRGKFMATLPSGMLVCERCESLAIQAGEKTSDEICGRTVDLGRVRPCKNTLRLELSLKRY